jgi:hypothetical protein
MLLNTLLLALRSIRRNLLRSFLTILGIVIGVSAVITMVTVGNGATLAVQNQISSLGTNLLQVRPGQRMGPGSGGGQRPFKDSDAEAIASQIGGVAGGGARGAHRCTLVANGRNWSSSVTGSTNELAHHRQLDPGRGARVHRRRAARRRGGVHDRRDRAPRAVRQQPSALGAVAARQADQLRGHRPCSAPRARVRSATTRTTWCSCRSRRCSAASPATPASTPCWCRWPTAATRHASRPA